MSKEIPDILIDTDDIHILTDILHPYAVLSTTDFFFGVYTYERSRGQ
jgi:hypothetical protein